MLMFGFNETGTLPMMWRWPWFLFEMWAVQYSERAENILRYAEAKIHHFNNNKRQLAIKRLLNTRVLLYWSGREFLTGQFDIR